MLVEVAAAMFLQGAGAPVSPRIDPYLLCVCKRPEGDPIRFVGVASDAQLTLGADGLSTEDRQATIFTVVRVKSGDVKSPAKVYHSTNPAKCGISFNYGKRYEIVGVLKNGLIETDWCQMGKPR
jgi:hypothetical protein